MIRRRGHIDYGAHPVFSPVTIENLNLIPVLKVHAAVSAGRIRVFHIQNEITVLLFGPEIRIVTLPPAFAFTRLNQQ